jgi:hypothetical protein
MYEYSQTDFSVPGAFFTNVLEFLNNLWELGTE